MNTCEPIAIVGMGCRFPGADSPRRLWELVLGEVDAVTTGRSDGDAPEFAPEDYFVTERENATLDPQHRVLLACARDALADAGLCDEAIAGQDVGVFMGQSTGEHWDRLRGETTVDMYAIATAAARGMASGRVSYAWDLRGPCATVDAACSSGTLAVHLACQSLRTGECDTALAGGVSLVLGTDHTDGYSAAGMLSSSGRCRFGHEDADGFVRADGAGVVVLKRLSRAQADGDTIHALILGSAQASKGRTAKAIIAPSVEGYVQVITRAAVVAGVTPAAIGYVEAHGNAAPAGDRLELQAIGATIGVHRDEPCLVGSVKTNIGHPEAAGGMAGLMKAAFAVRERTVPASLHSDRPTSQIDWPGLNIAPVPSVTPWPGTGPAIAGVSSYGLSGTFVHLLVGEPPSPLHGVDQSAH
ncbi:Beta-ketoacyl synthase, C-terminal domain [Lentzea waywayandensis]|uniref:Beta-ketoacyl synthase, C-terminal domain n=1 Tax=Lentzea waywayandensis TaxID=84724 RepID=A0A1I6FDX3_9PSEU|nr:polyketide synthase [Lentzea waywayandensis]SFR27957.1 Beta-ketoacyl synthase, C-terminal domain [Lentzea waywayandensis]